uniref:Cystatin F n=1 Tax=Bos taurus TaxID=9913 RepID=A0AAA9TZ89_BOVIN
MVEIKSALNHQLQFLPSTCFLNFQRSSTRVARGPGSLVVSAQSPGSDGRPPDFCSQILKSDAKPGFPKTIKTNDPDVLRAARHSAESFNNCSNDAFLFRESRVSRALVQIVKGLKFMLDMDIGRTTCKKTGHANLDDCSFQTNHTLQWTLSCYSEVWVVPWLQTTEVSLLHCH